MFYLDKLLSVLLTFTLYISAFAKVQVKANTLHIPIFVKILFIFFSISQYNYSFYNKLFLFNSKYLVLPIPSSIHGFPKEGRPPPLDFFPPIAPFLDCRSMNS